jgi:hypothetical protein
MTERPDGTWLETDSGVDELAGEHPREIAPDPHGPGGPLKAAQDEVSEQTLALDPDALPDLDTREARQAATRKPAGPSRRSRTRWAHADEMDAELGDILGDVPDLPSPPPSDPV